MPTMQTDIVVDDELKAPDGERSTLYLTMACHTCGTRRTFRVGAVVSHIQNGQIDGYMISTFCDECERGVVIQIFAAKDKPYGFSNIPLFPENEDSASVMDAVGLAKWPST